jgi:hypothetical protein
LIITFAFNVHVFNNSTTLKKFQRKANNPWNCQFKWEEARKGTKVHMMLKGLENGGLDHLNEYPWQFG